MDYVRLATENSQLSNYAKQSNNILLKFNSLLKTIHKQNETYISKIQKQLEEFHSELQHAPIYTTMHYNFTNFTNQFNDFLTNTHKINEQFQNQIIVPLISFSSAQSKKRSKNLATFETFIKHITETKIKLEKTKHIYFDSVKETRQQERNVVKIIEQGKQDEIKKAHALLYQLEDITDKKTIFYNEELAKMNLVLEEGEKTYNEIISSLQTEEENCFKYLNEVFINMQNLTKTVHSNQNICIEKMQKSINLTNIKRDMSVYINNYDFKNEKKNRFDKELFFNYDDYIRSLEQATVPQKNELLDKIEDKKILFEQKNAITSSKASLNDLNITTISASTTSLIKDKKEDNEHNTKDINNKKGNQSYKKIINQLIHSSNPISNDELVIIFNEIQNNPDKSKEFLEQLKDYYDGHVFVSIENEYNMHHLTSIFILILNSLQTKEEMFISCIFTIISMSEETLYIDPNSIFNKYYLCKFLSYKHKKLFTKELWMKLIEIQISFLLDKEIKQIIEKKEQITKTDDRTVLNKVKNIFSLSQNKIKENRKIENNILYGKLYQERQPFVAVKILEDFLQHFACFNCDISISNEIVIELAQKYKFSQEHSNYFRAILNSNLFGEDRDFKNETFYQQKHSVNPNIDYSLQIFYKNNLFHKITQKNRDENTFIIIINSCKYLHPKELIDILCINKSYNRKASKIIYKNILLKYHNMNIDSRMKLWKSIINIFKIKREYNYKNIINTLKSSGTKDIPNNDIIDMDVLRTPFETNREENKTKISNILKALAKAVPHIKYSQGMNYIAAFILNLFKDEEESFYFYVALLKTTQYGELFINDLEKLKMFFYVFERILKLFSPELMNYLTRSNITVSYFISPWFITLFTNSYNFIKNKELPKVLLMIWEQFLFGGWEEIIKFGTYLIKYYEKQLLDIKTEELLQFLLNDLIKTSFFQNDNYNTLMYINSNLEIEDGLVKNIENEYELKKKLGSGFQEDKMTV